MKINSKDLLRRKIRESSLSGGEVLRSLDKAVEKLEEFISILGPLQATAQKLGEESTKIDKTLIEIKDQATATKDAYRLIKDLETPFDCRSHVKNIEKAQQMLVYFQNSKGIKDESIVENLGKGINVGCANCVKFIEEQIMKYNEMFANERIKEENSAQLDLIGTIRELVEICRVKVPSYWQSYVKLRAGWLVKYVNVSPGVSEPYVKGSHFILKVLDRFIQCCEIERDLLVSVLGTSTVQDWLGEVTEPAFQVLYSQTEAVLGKKSNIAHLLDILQSFHHSLEKIEQLLGKSVKYYAISKLYTTILQKCQAWYREYIQQIQSMKLEFGDSVHEMSIQLSRDLKEVYKYEEAVLIAKLEQSIINLITTLSDSYKLKIKAQGNKNPGLSQIFLINNMSFLISVMSDLNFSGNDDAMSRIEREMLSEIEEYTKNTWSKLMPVLSESPNIIEFKKPGILTPKSRKEVKKKFTNFNSIFPEIFNYHKNFAINNRDILQLLRKKHVNLIVPAYKEFLKRYLAVDFTTRREKYTLFPAENLEKSLANMYSYRP